MEVNLLLRQSLCKCAEHITLVFDAKLGATLFVNALLPLQMLVLEN